MNAALNRARIALRATALPEAPIHPRPMPMFPGYILTPAEHGITVRYNTPDDPRPHLERMGAALRSRHWLVIDLGRHLAAYEPGHRANPRACASPAKLRAMWQAFLTEDLRVPSPASPTHTPQARHVRASLLRHGWATPRPTPAHLHPTDRLHLTHLGLAHLVNRSLGELDHLASTAAPGKTAPNFPRRAHTQITRLLRERNLWHYDIAALLAA